MTNSCRVGRKNLIKSRIQRWRSYEVWSQWRIQGPMRLRWLGDSKYSNTGKRWEPLLIHAHLENSRWNNEANGNVALAWDFSSFAGRSWDVGTEHLLYGRLGWTVLWMWHCSDEGRHGRHQGAISLADAAPCRRTRLRYVTIGRYHHSSRLRARLLCR